MSRSSEGEFPTVLSTVQADSGRTITSLEAEAGSLVNEQVPDPGFRFNTVIVSSGLGSFRIATPKEFSAPWRFGTPAGDFLAEASARDSQWAEFWGPRLESGDNPRALLMDLATQDAAVVVHLTLSPEVGLLGQELADHYASGYKEIGPVSEAHKVVVNGVDGAYVEYLVPKDRVGGTSDRVQQQVLIPDPPNRVLWGVTCDVPAPLAAETKALCAKIAASFEPLPAIEG
ncbi:MAG: hypothetical protein ACT4OM_03785 [Actinomycetota bacterium]